MTLNQINKGDRVKIIHISHKADIPQLMRLGIYVGVIVYCIGKLSMNGPIIVRKKRQEIAIGHKLAKSIYVDIELNS